ARAAAARRALLHLSGARLRERLRPPVGALGRVRAPERAGRRIRDEARLGARADLSGVPRALPEGGGAMSSPLSHGADWDFELLEKYDAAIGQVAGEF